MALSESLKTIICEDNMQLAEDMASMIQRRVPGMHVVDTATNGEECIQAVKDFGAKILLLDTSLPYGDDVTEITQQVRKLEPECIIFWLSDYFDLAMEKGAKSVGVQECLHKPLRADELQLSVNRAIEEERKRQMELAQLNQNNAQPSNLGQQMPTEALVTQQRFGVVRQEIIAVFSPKGGVGKTALSAHLALGLQTNQVLPNALKVVVVDLDLHDPNLNIVMSQELQGADATICTIADRGMTAELTPENIDQFLATHKSGMRVLLGPPTTFDVPKVTEELLDKVIYALSKRFDFVVLDLGPIMNNLNLLVLERATKIIVPTTVDSTGIAGVKRWVDTMREAELDIAKAKLVLTRIEKTNDHDEKEITQFVPLPILGRIPDDRRARTIMNHGGLVDLYDQKSMFAEGLKQVGQKIVPVFQTGRKGNKELMKKAQKQNGGQKPTGKQQGKGQKKGGFSLFRRA